jgi:hypothetical protein
VEHEHLPVALRAGADADGRDRHRLADARGHRGRHEFEHHGERPGLLEPARLVDEARRAGLVAPLHAEAAEQVDRLRREAEVAHDGDAGAAERAHRCRRSRASRPRASPRRSASPA